MTKTFKEQMYEAATGSKWSFTPSLDTNYAIKSTIETIIKEAERYEREQYVRTERPVNALSLVKHLKNFTGSKE